MAISPKEITALLDGPYAGNIPDYRDLPKDPVRRVSLLKKEGVPQDSIRGLLELSELRFRARFKFSRASEMFFDREALEQSTGENVAKWRAERFRGFSSVADLTCGIGGDTAALAGVTKVFAQDVDYHRVRMAEANAEVYQVFQNVTFRDAPAEEYPNAEALFIDPSRRDAGRRSRFFSTLSPHIDSIRDILRAFPNAGLKLSPAAPDEELRTLGGSLEFVSLEGVCRETIVWYGKLARSGRRAIILPQNIEVGTDTHAPAPEISEARKYLLEPDPAVIRAGCIPQVCQMLNAAVMDPRIAYLTSDELPKSPLASGWEILASMPFNVKHLRPVLQEMGVGQVEVKKRGSTVEVDSIRDVLTSRRLPGRAVVVLTRINNRAWSLICKAK